MKLTESQENWNKNCKKIVNRTLSSNFHTTHDRQITVLIGGNGFYPGTSVPASRPPVSRIGHVETLLSRSCSLFREMKSPVPVWIAMLKESNRIPRVVLVSLGRVLCLVLRSSETHDTRQLDRQLIAQPGDVDSWYNGFRASYTSLSTGRIASLIDEDVVRGFFS